MKSIGKVGMWVMVVGLIGMTAGQTLGSIQPAMDNVYGNAIVLNAGDTAIWDGGLSEEQFKNTLFSIDAQLAPDYMTWVQDPVNGRNLMLTSNHWANGAITHKIVAPAGQTFAGGTITFRGCGVWGGAPAFNVRTSSAYGNNEWGLLDTAKLGTIYSVDNHEFATDWTFDNWTVNVPTGVSEFYVSVESSADWHTTWGNEMQASNVVLVPEPIAVLMFSLGGVILVQRRR